MNNTNITDHDRAQLAAKLDQELEQWMDTLEQKKYQDGWPEDRWQEEMAKHPFFMKQSPAEGQPVSPLVEGLQKLKYDPDENTPEELAMSYKEDGNFNFKHKNYRLAIIGYTEGISIKCGDDKINASLYNNRSASHFFLENYRSSFNDAKKTLSFEPDHPKALLRAAQCALKLKEFEACTEYCDKILSKDKDNETAKKIKLDIKNYKLIHERDERRKNIKEKKQISEDESLLNAIKERGIFIEEGKETMPFVDYNPGLSNSEKSKVSWDEDKKHLVWFVLFLYPQYEITDFVPGFCETTHFCDLFSKMFETYPEWDTEKQYTVDNINVYYKGRKNYKLFPLDCNKTLLEVMKEPYFELRSWVPEFIVLIKNSSSEKAFLKMHGL